MARRIFIVLLAAACIGEPDSEDPPVCSSGVLRSPNATEDEFMTPGRACNDCHRYTNSGDSTEAAAPIFAFAGTVYPTRHEPNDCEGKVPPGAYVELVDAKGRAYTARVNRVGNFQFDNLKIALPEFPATTRLVAPDGRSRWMVGPILHGDCNICHTQTGTQAAPGRIQLPE